MDKQKFIDLLNNKYNENNTINDIKKIINEWDYYYIIMKNNDCFIWFKKSNDIVFDETLYF